MFCQWGVLVYQPRSCGSGCFLSPVLRLTTSLTSSLAKRTVNFTKKCTSHSPILSRPCGKIELFLEKSYSNPSALLQRYLEPCHDSSEEPPGTGAPKETLLPRKRASDFL